MRPRFFYTFLIFALLTAPAVAGAENTFDRTRHKAALIALLCYNPVGPLKKDFLCQRAYLSALCRMFVQEGGYYAGRVPEILELKDPTIERVAALFRELDGRAPPNGMPRALQMASAVALAYTEPSPSGVYAAMHAARLVEADPDTDAVARAAYSLLVNIIGGQERDKRALLNIAALNADDETVAAAVRAVPLREWRHLAPENTGVGRLCRALKIWFHATDWRDAEIAGQKQLRYYETRRFLGVVSATWFDLSNLPDDLLWEAANDRDCAELCAGLYNLTRQILITVPKSFVLPELAENSVITAGKELDDYAAEISALPAPSEPVSPSVASAPMRPREPSMPTSPHPTTTVLLSTPLLTPSAPNPQSPNSTFHHYPPPREIQPAGDYLRSSFPLN
ncbi:hypothetical protein FACS1894139_03960 [Planctomycetales bacterium]|nr:hypothetical protein FACS1894108_03750 [Planctomycetales bacterium]GHT03515.1 hypothetical protein FACS1894139_03960 [Planctomycetales bacterium]GHV19719.1 hypothetical protein AGMMS49959_05500 [Planctomycetales bacterium]